MTDDTRLSLFGSTISLFASLDKSCVFSSSMRPFSDSIVSVVACLGNGVGKVLGIVAIVASCVLLLFVAVKLLLTFTFSDCNLVGA